MTSETKPPGDASEDSAKIAAELRALLKLSKTEAKFRTKVRDELELSLRKNMDLSKETIAKEVAGDLDETFARQNAQFETIERRLILSLTAFFTGKYQGIIFQDEKDRIRLLQHIENMKGKVLLETDLAASAGTRELFVDMALVVAAGFAATDAELIPEEMVVTLGTLLPAATMAAVFCLVVVKVLFRRERLRVAKTLKHEIQDEWKEATKIGRSSGDTSNKPSIDT